jgi:hypothetical protein
VCGEEERRSIRRAGFPNEGNEINNGRKKKQKKE